MGMSRLFRVGAQNFLYLFIRCEYFKYFCTIKYLNIMATTHILLNIPSLNIKGPKQYSKVVRHQFLYLLAISIRIKIGLDHFQPQIPHHTEDLPKNDNNNKCSTMSWLLTQVIKSKGACVNEAQFASKLNYSVKDYPSYTYTFIYKYLTGP